MKSTKFCGTNNPAPYESSGNELTIAFVADLTSERSSLNRQNQENKYVQDITLNKTIEVFERQAPSCMHCFRIKVSKDDSMVDSTMPSSPLLILGTAGAATLLAGKKLCHRNILDY